MLGLRGGYGSTCNGDEVNSSKDLLIGLGVVTCTLSRDFIDRAVVSMNMFRSKGGDGADLEEEGDKGDDIRLTGPISTADIGAMRICKRSAWDLLFSLRSEGEPDWPREASGELADTVALRFFVGV